MADYEFVTLDVFTDTRFGGNPLAVFPDARGLDERTMQQLARELNMSEVAFVLPPADARNSARVRIYTTEMEIAFAGHPNVGVGWLLAERGLAPDDRLLFEEIAGLVEVRVERTDGTLRNCRVLAPQPVSLGTAPSRAELAACASLTEAEIGEPMLSSVALATVCVPVTTAALRRAACDVAAFRAVAARRPDLARIFLLCLYARDGDRAEMRVFAPLSGTIEDPATGSAAAALVGGLLLREGGDRLSITVRQGENLGRPSRIAVDARRDGGEVRVWLGGGCVPVLRGVASV